MYELSGRWQQGSRSVQHPGRPQWMRAYLAEQQWVGVEEAVIWAVMEEKIRQADARRAPVVPLLPDLTQANAAARMRALFRNDPKPRTVLQLADTLLLSRRYTWRTIAVLVREGHLTRQSRPQRGRPRWSYYGPATRAAA